MAVTGLLYGPGFLHFFDGGIDWDTHTIKVSLHTSTYVPNQDTHDFFDDTTNEVVGTGYVAGGAALGSKTLTYTGATNKIKLDAADTTWATSTITARTAVVRCAQTGVSSTEPLIGYELSDSNIVSSAGDFTIVWDSGGIVEITVA
jgi:hypothetical protein